MKVGSLFAGYDGLGLAVESLWPESSRAWFVEFAPAPSRVLAHRWPDVPNYGDVTTVDWADVGPVDVLTGGFPCQDLSFAGKRAGLRPGTRSGLWSHMAHAIDQLRPSLVVIENVRGILSAGAHGDMERDCPPIHPRAASSANVTAGTAADAPRPAPGRAPNATRPCSGVAANATSPRSTGCAMGDHELTFERDAYAVQWSCSCGWVGQWGHPGSAGAEAVRHARGDTP